jgi:hypothetical protein
MSGSPASWDNGKIGKCATWSGSISNVIYNNTTEFNYTDNFSWCCWVKPNYSSTANDTIQYAFTVGRADGGGYGYGLKISSESRVEVKFKETYTVSCNSNEWTHIAFTKSGTTIKIYKNGILYSTNTFSSYDPAYSDGNGLGIGCFHYASGDIHPYYGSLNDFRIYDNCLNAKEVELIARGLVCHYPLNTSYETGLQNKYSSPYSDGYFWNIAGFTRTKLQDERGYNYKGTYTSNNGSTTWYYAKLSKYTFTSGKKYYYSVKVRCNKCSNGYIQLRASRSDNDWVTNMRTICSASLADGEWHEYYISQTVNDTYDRSGSTVTCAPMLEIYSSNLNGDGTVYEVDFDIKDVQVVESDCYVPFIDNSMSSNIVADTSGYDNNGTRSGNLVWDNDSPKYLGCYEFSGSQYIACGKKAGRPTDAITVAWWGYMDDWSECQKAISCTENGGYGFPTANSEYIKFSIYLSGLGYVRANDPVKLSDLSSGWHHWVGTYGKDAVKLYRDGELVNSTVPSSLNDISYNNSVDLLIGAEPGSTVSEYFTGKLSDVRIYSTALSTEAIKELYNTSAIVTSSGSSVAYEYVEE